VRERDRGGRNMSQTRRALGGLRWVGASRLLTQCVTWGMTIFTMRALQPSDYGIVATAGLFMILAALLLDAGLSIVLISRRELPLELQGAAASAVLGLSFILALGIAIVAPAGATFFRNPDLIAVLRVCALQLPLSALAVVPSSVLARNMNFRQIAVGQSIAAILQGIATLTMARLGAAYWSLIFGVLFGLALKAVWLCVAVRPSFNLRFKLLRPLLASSAHMLGQRILYFVSAEFDIFLLGRLAGASALGSYSLAKMAAHTVLDQIAGSVNQITVPSFAAKGGDDQAQLTRLVSVISVTSAVVFPLFWLLGTLSPVALPLLFGQRWTALVVPFAAFAIMLPLRGIYTILDWSVVGTGGMSTSFKNMTTWAAIMMPALTIGAFHGPNATAVAWAVAFPLVFLVSMMRISKKFNARLLRLLQPLLVPAAGAAGSCLVVLAIGIPLQHRLPPLGLLCIEAVVGAGCYWAAIRRYGRSQHDLIKSLVLGLLLPRRRM